MDEDLKELERHAQQANDAANKARQKLELAIAKANAARMEPLKKLVIRAHACLCSWNHTDGCSWGYEEGDDNPWNGGAHDRWLRRYDALINGTTGQRPEATAQEVEDLLDAIETVKPKVKTALWLIRSGRLVP